jgi:hypothetical protein
MLRRIKMPDSVVDALISDSLISSVGRSLAELGGPPLVGHVLVLISALPIGETVAISPMPTTVSIDMHNQQ